MRATKVIFVSEGGIQKLYRFPNGRGASVICTSYSYGGRDGLWELSVLRWRAAEADIHDYRLDYTTPITGDVLGYLTDEEVEDALQRIVALLDYLPNLEENV